MNKLRRSSLLEAVGFLKKAQEIISSALDKEQDALDNIPENLMCGDRYGQIETAIEQLEFAEENVEDAIENVNNAIR